MGPRGVLSVHRDGLDEHEQSAAVFCQRERAARGERRAVVGAAVQAPRGVERERTKRLETEKEKESGHKQSKEL